MNDKQDQQEDFYYKLREDIRIWFNKWGNQHRYSEYLMLAPDIFYLLYRLTLDKEVPLKEKTKLATTIAYFLLPIDFIPEAFIGIPGYVDDMALAVFVLNAIINNTDPEIVRKHWVGDEDILKVIKRIIKVADRMVGSGLWEKLKGLIK